MTDETFDVVVAGAGAVGLAAAIGFARRGVATCLLGPAGIRSDGRTAALLDRSMTLLRALGVGEEIERRGAPLRQMRLVDDTDSLFRPPPALFRADEIGLDAFGWNVENAALVEILVERARATPGLVWRETLVGDYREGSPATITLQDGTSVSGRLVCAADGRRSRLRAAAGLPGEPRDLPQVALTTILAHARPHEGVSTEFHTRAGPCTTVPLPGQRSSIVWVSEPHHAARLAALDDAAFAAAIGRRTHGVLGPARIDGPRGSVRLQSLSVPRLAEGRLVLLGEAAHVLPPIGAQGLNLGLADVDALLALAEGRVGDDLGAGPLPRLYAERRRGDVALRGAGVGALNRALLSRSPLVDAARGLGLGLLGQVAPLRRAAMRAGLT